MNLYNLNSNEFIKLIHSNRKTLAFTTIELEQVLKTETDIELKIIKLIDKTFNKGLTWYISKKKLPSSNKSSIFFRKNVFNSELDFESKKKINEYEQRKIEIQTLCKLINFKPKRILKTYCLEDNPQQVALDIRQEFNNIEKLLLKEIVIKQPKTIKDFLKNSIRILEDMNIFIFEFTENWNKKNKASFNGFYISPNIIVIKRQEFIRREIFTLFHEFAHYLLQHEEIDCVSEADFSNLNRIEKWCHTFSFYFLLGNFHTDFSKLKQATEENNFHQSIIYKLYNNTNLSYSALYTRLRINNKITQTDYENIMEKIRFILKQISHDKKEKAKLEREIAKEKGKKTFAFQKPIESNLFKEIVRINYFEGNINENSLRDYLHISDNKSIDSVIY